MTLSGWILDLYPSADGMTLWLIPRTREGERQRLRLIDRSFAPCFYVYGPEPRLRCLAQTLARRAPVGCALTEKMNLWDGRLLRVLAVSVRHPTQFTALARFARRFDPGLRLYNSDLMLAPLYCWDKNIFPLAKVEIELGAPPAGLGTGFKLVPTKQGTPPAPVWEVRAIECRDDAWDIDYELPPLRVLEARLEGLSRVNPQHGRHGALEVATDGRWCTLDDSDEPAAAGFERLLRAHDPDLIVSEWGDSTLFPGLLRSAAAHGIQLSFNREKLPVERRRARSYTSYGRILFKESTATLFGRLHVDTQNSFIADHPAGAGLEGLWELARLTKLPVQYCARTTTGTGISYMQMELAYRDGALIPEQKAEPESPKHPDELLAADRGGLVFPPRLGFFTNVGELDFVSEYPSIMARFNISPETINCACCPDAPRVPELGYRVCRRRRGITSRVVERLIEKRQQFKQRMMGAASRHAEPSASSSDGDGYSQPPPDRKSPRPSLDDRAASYNLRRSALKWLLVCCFGYTGYKNARFGKIEAHEAINAMAREKLLVAKERAEEQGFRVLHALVDSLYVERAGATRQDYERLAREIEQQTGLPMALEAVYRYVVFLPSKQSPEIPVPNRFFAVPEEGKPKIRGLECRRHDTPPLVVKMQTEALAVLAEARDFESYNLKLAEAREVLARYLARLEEGSAPLEDLVISRRLTRPPDAYRYQNVTAIVARQLDRAGVKLHPGETVEYILTDVDSNLPDDRVRAWTLWEGWRGYDVKEYQRALRDAFKAFEHFASLPLTFNLALTARSSYPAGCLEP